MPTEIIYPPAEEEEESAVTAGEEERFASGGGANEDDSVTSAPAGDESHGDATSPTHVNDESSKADTGTPSSAADGHETPAKKKRKPPPPKKGRSPAVKGLSIPFRTVKKAMKLDPDIPIVQNEAAIMVTMAAELFLKSLAKESQQIAKNRGRNTIRYEDIAEARSNDPSLLFLSTLIP